MSGDRTHAILAPSSAHRWLKCTPSARLEAQLPDTAGVSAAEGTLAHSVCELVAKKRFKNLPESEFESNLNQLKQHELWHDEMLKTADIYVTHLTESIAMIFKSDPHIVFEMRVDLTEYIPDAFGTCDCIIIGGNLMMITDYKHGKSIGVSAKKNPQLMLYALGALNNYAPIYGDTIEKVRLCVEQPRYGSYINGYYDAYEITVDELYVWANETVKPQAALAYAGTGDYTAGSHCMFFRAKPQCRHYASHHTALEDFMHLADPSDANTELISSLLSDDEIGKLLERGATLVNWYNSMKNYALKTCLKGGSVTGWKAVAGRSTRTWKDQDKAIYVLIESGLDRDSIYENTPKSLPQIEKQLGKKQFNDLMYDYIIKQPGKPTLVKATDSREAYNGAYEDFNGILDDTGDVFVDI